MDSFINGLLWGCGLMVAVIALTPLYFMLYRWMLRGIGREFRAAFGTEDEVTFGRDARFQVSDLRFEEREPAGTLSGERDDMACAGREVAVVCRVGNPTEHTWEDVTVEFDFLNDRGRLVERERSSIGGPVRPGESRWVKESTYPDHPFATIEARVVSADWLRPAESSNANEIR